MLGAPVKHTRLWVSLKELWTSFVLTLRLGKEEMGKEKAGTQKKKLLNLVKDFALKELKKIHFGHYTQRKQGYGNELRRRYRRLVAGITIVSGEVTGDGHRLIAAVQENKKKERLTNEQSKT